MKVEIIKIPIYEYDLVVIVGEIKKSHWKKLKRELPDEPDIDGLRTILDNRYSAITCNRSQNIVIHFNKKPTANTIAHEAFHAVEYLMKGIGSSHGGKSCEPWAYLLGWMVQEIHDLKIVNDKKK